MTKELKFRDWDPETKEMRYFNLDGYDREVHNAYGNIMQYTGLEDKNGKEVYEGDIVEYIDRSPVIPEQRTAIVKFIGGNVDYANNLLISPFVNIGNFNYKTNFIMGTLNNPAESIIIGNIYQNPELLGGENE